MRPKEIFPQGAGSDLDADKIHGNTLEQLMELVDARIEAKIQEWITSLQQEAQTLLGGTTEKSKESNQS